MSVAISEKALQQRVIDFARLCGWHHIYHTWNSIHSAPGFFDLILVRDRIVAMELKREGKHLTPAQEDWARAWRNAGGECYWFSSSERDWLLIRKVLDPEGRTS